MKRQSWYIIIGATMALSISITSVSTYFYWKSEKEIAMIHELNQMRAAVRLYKKTHQKNPASLMSAMSVNYAFSAPRWTIAMNQKGMLIDPFGGHYAYNANSGWVRSGTKKYSAW